MTPKNIITLKKAIISDTYFLLADYKIGQKVYYLPKLSGFNNSKPLTISGIRIETHDLFGKEHELPIYIYSFEKICLAADEINLSLNKPI